MTMPALYTYNNKTGALERFGSFEKFNRVLYGGHANDARQDRSFTFAGDTPIFLGAASDFSKNTGLREAFQDHARRYRWKVYIPPFSYTTDNAAMIACTGYFKYLDKDFCGIDVPIYSNTRL